jgi:prepilin peptidase CpaA
MTPLPIPIQILLAATVLIAAATDLRKREIPNWLTFGAILAGLILHPVLSGWAGLRLSLVGFLIAALIFLPLFVLRFLGGGDVKLMGAIGAIAGQHNLLVIFILDALFAGIAAIILIIVRRRVKQTLRNIAQGFRSLGKGRAPHADNPEMEAGSEQSLGMPRGVTIALATLVALFFGIR